MKLGDLLGGIKKEQSKEEPSKDMTKSMIKTPSVVEAADKPLFNNLRKLINIIDSFRDIGLQEHISLPKIAVCGDQSSGKSSLLENIVGMDFLPRGSGVVTRRPLELRLVHVDDPDAKPYGIFSVEPNTKYTDFDKIRMKIEELTDLVAGKKKGIVDDPIKLVSNYFRDVVFSNECPDLTLIDLPGITRVALQNSDQQAVDIEAVTTGLVAKYCKEDDRTIILAVVPANVDLSTSHALDMARKWDSKGERTLGVITKIDLMDRGTDARAVLSNKQIPLRYGYVGIKNRSQEDIMNKVKVKESLDKEEKFFRQNPIYCTMDSSVLGTRALTRKLTEILFKSIKSHLPTITREINEKVKECEDKLKSLGDPLPREGKEKIHMLWKLITEFTEQFRAQIKGKYEYNVAKESKGTISGGALVKIMFTELYQEFSDPSYKVTSGISDKEIQRAIDAHQGDSIPGFPSVHAFMYLLSDPLEKLRKPAHQTLKQVFEHLRLIATQLIQNVFVRFQEISDEIVEIADEFFAKQMEKAKEIVDANLDSEIHYVFTNDDTYLKTRTRLIPVKDKPKAQAQNQDKGQASNEAASSESKDGKWTNQFQNFLGIKKDQPNTTPDPTKNVNGGNNAPQGQPGDKPPAPTNPNDPNYQGKNEEPKIQNKASGPELTEAQKQKLREDAKRMFVEELRLRVEHYFKIVVYTVRDIIPKNIGYFLVKMSQDNIQYALYNEVMKRSEMIDELGESPEITQQRETTKKTLDVLRKAQMTIRRDPDFEGRIGEEKKSE